MKIQQLRSLVALVDAGSIRGAARALGLTQPAVTASIAQLERDLGATLVNRTAKGTTLTPVGRALLPRARAIVHDVNRTREEISQLVHDGAGSITLGASPIASIELVAPVLDALRAEFPRASIRIVDGLFQEVSAALREGLLDLVVAPIPGTRRPDKLFVTEPLVAYPMHVVARRGHPLLRKVSRLADLADAQWVVGARTSDRRSTVEELFLEHGLPAPRIAVHANSIIPVQATLASTDLLGLLPPRLFLGWPELRLEILPVRETLKPTQVGLISRAGIPLTPITARLAELLRAQARKLIRPAAFRRA